MVFIPAFAIVLSLTIVTVIGMSADRGASKKTTSKSSGWIATIFRSKKYPRFQTKEAKAIWRLYNLLDKPYQDFPELRSTLLALDSETVALGWLDRDDGELRHESLCRNTPYLFHVADKPACQACREYEKLKEAVNDLLKSQKRREAALARGDVDPGTLAERIKMMAKETDSITDQVFN